MRILQLNRTSETHKTQLTMFSFDKCSVRRVQSFEKCIFVLYFVLLAAIDLSYTVDGLSTTNERSMYSHIFLYFPTFLVVFVELPIFPFC